MKHVNLEALTGKEKIAELARYFAKEKSEREMLLKATSPSVRVVPTDEIKRAYDADPAYFAAGIEEYLKTAKTDSDRVVEFVGSTERQDRDQDRILVKGWETKEWKRNPVFLWAHNYASFPMGTGLKVWKDYTDKEKKALMFYILFPEDLKSEEAQKQVDFIHAMYTSSPPMVRAVSVGFLGLSYERPETQEDQEKLDVGQWGVLFDKQELWELSGCPIGSNYDSLSTRSKSLFGKGGGTILDALGMEITTDKKFLFLGGIDIEVEETEGTPEDKGTAGDTPVSAGVDGVEGAGAEPTEGDEPEAKATEEEAITNEELAKLLDKFTDAMEKTTEALKVIRKSFEDIESRVKALEDTLQKTPESEPTKLPDPDEGGEDAMVSYLGVLEVSEDKEEAPATILSALGSEESTT